MKKLTCRDLGGPCDEEFSGNSFAEIGNKCRTHVMEEISSGNESHKVAASKMRNATPEEQAAMMAAFEKKFQEAPET